jgi:hypothetical protein
MFKKAQLDDLKHMRNIVPRCKAREGGDTGFA